MHGAGAGAAFAADYQPVDAGEVQAGEGAEQGLGADEADGGGDGAEVVDTKRVAGVLDTNAHPDVVGPVEFGSESGEALGALGEDLVRVPGGVGHYLEDLADEVERYLRMEEVAH